jgi:acetolactate synthase small subunit
MKTFEIVLTKSYIIKIKAENEEKAKRYAELFTGDVKDISTEEYRKKFLFEIEDIDCKVNEAFEAKEVI